MVGGMDVFYALAESLSNPPNLGVRGAGNVRGIPCKKENAEPAIFSVDVYW
jgi:hypothetical protein